MYIRKSDTVAVIDLDEQGAVKAALDIESWFVENGDAKPGEIEVMGVGCDVSDEEAVKVAFEAIHQRFGRIDVLV